MKPNVALSQVEYRGEALKGASTPLSLPTDRPRAAQSESAKATIDIALEDDLSLFEAQAEKTPEAVAVVFEDRHLSYAELNSKTNRLAYYLRELGVKPDDRVGICVGRSLEMLVGVLATLKAGGAYVPLDPVYPAERLAFMVQDSAPLVLLTDTKAKNALTDHFEGLPSIDLEADSSCWAGKSESNPDRVSIGLAPQHLAYVIYTSGSTGKPKGVMVERSGLQNLLRWYVHDFQLSSSNSILVVTSQSFDLTQKNLLGPLLVGGRVHLAKAPFDPASILHQIVKEKIDVLNLAPSAFHALVAADEHSVLSRLHRVFLGGEPVQAKKLLALQEPRPEFVNSYGPTECTDVVAAYRMSPNLQSYSDRSVPLGTPISNTSIYILDANRQPVPVGVTGELYIGGVGVARGYLNRPELTAERFLPDPFSKEQSARMYKTGDLGRWLVNGEIEFLGRNDFQVKIRGFRIELEEVEAALLSVPDVNEACVAVAGTSEMSALIGFVAVAKGHHSSAYLRNLLKQHGQLPDYMIPSHIVCLDSLPLTVNGKKDRKRLLELYRSNNPAISAAIDTHTISISTGKESVRAAWVEVLGHSDFADDDNFFDVGGTSLRAAKAHSILSRHVPADVAFSIISFFEHPTVKSLAALIDTKPHAPSPGNPAALKGEQRRRSAADRANRLRGRSS